MAICYNFTVQNHTLTHDVVRATASMFSLTSLFRVGAVSVFVCHHSVFSEYFMIGLQQQHYKHTHYLINTE